MRKIRRLGRAGIVSALCVVALSGCGISKGITDARAAVNHFHEQLNAEQYEDILSQADRVFAASQSHDQMVKFLSAIHRKLGNAGEMKMTGFHLNYNSGGTFTTVSYSTTYANGQAEETFVWVKDGDKLKLYGYNINSMALITS